MPLWRIVKMIAALKLPYYPAKDYLALEEKAEYRSEYYQGEIFAMTGASISHNRIVSNLNRLIGNALLEQDVCEVFVNDMKVWIFETNSFTYPDIVVIKPPPVTYEGRNDVITNPLLIIEVLSKSTQDHDKGRKFDIYRALPSFKEYVLIDQYSKHITHFIKQDAKYWSMQEMDEQTESFTLQAINVSLKLVDIYQRVIF